MTWATLIAMITYGTWLKDAIVPVIVVNRIIVVFLLRRRRADGIFSLTLLNWVGSSGCSGGAGRVDVVGLHLSGWKVDVGTVVGHVDLVDLVDLVAWLGRVVELVLLRCGGAWVRLLGFLLLFCLFCEACLEKRRTFLSALCVLISLCDDDSGCETWCCQWSHLLRPEQSHVEIRRCE